MDYNKTYKSFINYADKCKNYINNANFTKEDTFDLNYRDELDINELIKNHRIKMIDRKVEHTMRMVKQIININKNLGIEINLNYVIKVATLYHDIGRLRQSTWSNTFNDSMYKNKNSKFDNHGEDGYDIFLNNDFNVYEKYIPVISETILHHQNHHTVEKLCYCFNGDLSNIDINKIITGNFELNEAEWQVASLIVQLVADVDKTDILYQHLLDDFEMIRDYVVDKSNDSLDNISKKWGISKKEILDFNKLDKNFSPQHLKIPIENVDLSKLEVPYYMKEMFYNNSWPELKILRQDQNWNFITILWWRLSFFLNDIAFNSTLITIEESKLLEQIYKKIPDRIKPLVYEAFEYAKEMLVKEKIEKNKGNIYLLLK